jgi:hypothetical protein
VCAVAHGVNWEGRRRNRCSQSHFKARLASSSQTGDAHLVSTLADRRRIPLRNFTAVRLRSPPAQQSLNGCAIARSGAPQSAPPHRKPVKYGGPRHFGRARSTIGTGLRLVRLVFCQTHPASPAARLNSLSPPHSQTRDSSRRQCYRAVYDDRLFHSDQVLASSSQTGDAHLVSTLADRRRIPLRNFTAVRLRSPPAQQSLNGCAIARSGGTILTNRLIAYGQANVQRISMIEYTMLW